MLQEPLWELKLTANFRPNLKRPPLRAVGSGSLGLKKTIPASEDQAGENGGKWIGKTRLRPLLAKVGRVPRFPSETFSVSKALAY
jgi:hypothetical protein